MFTKEHYKVGSYTVYGSGPSELRKLLHYAAEVLAIPAIFALMLAALMIF